MLNNHDIGTKIDDSYLIKEREVDPKAYPEFSHISAGFFYDILPNPKLLEKPEFVYIPKSILTGKRNHKIEFIISMWNLAWEAGQHRHIVKTFPKELKWLNAYRGQNIYLVPNYSFHKYDAYSPLFHLLKKDTLKRFGLPLIKKGHWPIMMPDRWLDRMLPKDFIERLACSIAYQLWPFIHSGSKISAFSKSDPIKILAHNLDFWAANIYMLIQKRVLSYKPGNLSERQIKKVKGVENLLPADVIISPPRGGGFLWWGETEATETCNEWSIQRTRAES